VRILLLEATARKQPSVNVHALLDAVRQKANWRDLYDHTNPLNSLPKSAD